MNKQVKFKSSTSIGQTLKRLWRYYSVEKWKVFFIAICLAIGVACNVLSSYFMPKVIEDIFVRVSGVAGVNSYYQPTGHNQLGPEFIWYGFLLVHGFIIIYILSMYLSNYLTIKISQNIGYQIRKDAFNKIQTLPLSYLDTKSVGDLTSRLTNDIDVVVTTSSQNSTQLIQGVLSVVGVFIAMMLLSSVITLIVLATIALTYSLVFIMVRFAQPHFKKQQIFIGEINSVTEEYISNHKVVNIFSYEQESIKKFSQICKELNIASTKAESISRSIMPYNNFVNNFVMSVILLVCIGFMISGVRFYGIDDINGNTDPGSLFSTMFTYVILVRQFTTPVSMIMTTINQLQLSIVGGSRAFEIIDAESEVEIDSNEELELKSTNVEFKNVSFAYDKNDPNKKIIKNLSFKAKDGTTNAIVGPTGSGKTTIISLLTRFYDIDEGQILIDGKNIFDYKRSELRRNITIVLQDSFLFSMSIRDNIRYGRMDATEEEIINAAKLSNAWTFIQQLPQGLDTIIDEEKDAISEGQKQLISIARAFLSKAKIIILDEATSYVDTKTEKDIQEGMARLMKGRTSFIIAHRLSTIKNSDNIIVLKNGELIEQGNHKQLMNKKGFYFNLSKSSTTYED